MGLKILFFTTALEHVTFRKTARMLSEEGAEVHMIGFSRNNFPTAQSYSLSSESAGQLSHGNYMRRMIRLVKFLPLLRRRAKDYEVIYNFNLDTFIISKIALLFQKKVFIYHIQDIRGVYFEKGLKGKVSRFLEGVFIKKADLVVVSSEDYYTSYFKPRYKLKRDKVVVIENKIIPGTIDISHNGRINDKLTVGYFGVMRCKRSWDILRDFALENKERVQLYLRGKPDMEPLLKEKIKDIENIYYGGLYKSPDDLSELYTKVDVVWAAYPYSELKDGNWRYARTIRFYEALAFGKPVIVQKGTPQEEDVRKNDIGLVIDMKDQDKTIKVLEKISQHDINTWKENIQSLNPSYFYHGSEYKNLVTVLDSLK